MEIFQYKQRKMLNHFLVLFTRCFPENLETCNACIVDLFFNLKDRHKRNRGGRCLSSRFGLFQTSVLLRQAKINSRNQDHYHHHYHHHHHHHHHHYHCYYYYRSLKAQQKHGVNKLCRACYATLERHWFRHRTVAMRNQIYKLYYYIMSGLHSCGIVTSWTDTWLWQILSLIRLWNVWIRFVFLPFNLTTTTTKTLLTSRECLAEGIIPALIGTLNNL